MVTLSMAGPWTHLPLAGTGANALPALDSAPAPDTAFGFVATPNAAPHKIHCRDGTDRSQGFFVQRSIGGFDP
jgi:hypothetical protein